MDSSQGLGSFVTFITSVGGTAVGAAVAWAVAKKKLLLPREVEQLDARIDELEREREEMKVEHAAELKEVKADRDRWIQTAMRSIENNERLQNTNEKAVGAVASIVQPKDHP